MTEGDLPQAIGGPAATSQPKRPISEVLRAFAGEGSESLTLGTIISASGSAVHGFALLLLALPEALPLPLPSASGVLGIPLIVLSAHLALFGQSARLPQRLLDLRIPRKALALVARYLSPALAWLERLSRPRWDALVQDERLIGLVCLCLSLILFLPLPFVNAPPALCLIAIALGMIQRDGLLIAVGTAGGAAIVAALSAGIYLAL
jgi:hypothetical protein